MVWLLGLGLIKEVTDKVLGMFYYFDGFPDKAGMVDPDIGYDCCSIEVDTRSCHVNAECLLLLIVGSPVWCLLCVPKS
jgi:hypothetical protein